MKLYQLANDYMQLLEKDDYTAEDMQQLEVLDDDIKSKAINIASYIKNLDGMLSLVTEARKDMQEREKRLDKKIATLSVYLKTTLMNCEIQAITDSPRFEIRVKKNPMKVDIFDEGALPTEFWVSPEPVFRPDKVRISEMLKSNQVVPGARLIQETRLEIK